LPEITTYFSEATANEKEFVRDFAIISESASVYATNTGYVLLRNDMNDTWRTLYQSPILKNYASLEASPCGRIAVAGCLGGKLAIVSMSSEFETLVADTVGGIKIQFVFVLGGTDKDNFRIVVFRANCTVGVFQLNISSPTQEATYRHLCELKLPNSNKAIHAAYYSARYNLVLLGSRDGTLLVYNLGELTPSQQAGTLDSIIELRKCHGNESVSSILMVTEEGEGNEGRDRIIAYSTGRDGSWTKYRFLGLPGGETLGSANDEQSDNEEDDDDDMMDHSGEDDDVVAASSPPRSRESTPGDHEGGTDIVLQKIFRSKITKGWLEQVRATVDVTEMSRVHQTWYVLTCFTCVRLLLWTASSSFWDSLTKSYSFTTSPSISR